MLFSVYLSIYIRLKYDNIVSSLSHKLLFSVILNYAKLAALQCKHVCNVMPMQEFMSSLTSKEE